MVNGAGVDNVFAIVDNERNPDKEESNGEDKDTHKEDHRKDHPCECTDFMVDLCSHL